LHWSRKETDFNEPKILIRQTADKIIGVYDNESYYPIDSIHTLNLINESKDEDELKIILGILNSKFIDFLYKWKLDEEGKVYPQIKKVNVEWFPIPDYKEAIDISIAVEKIQNIEKEREVLRDKFIKYIKSSLGMINNSSQIQQWRELEFGEFIIELREEVKEIGGQKLSKTDEMEWMELFENKKEETNRLKNEIEKTEQEIDQMVYKLYGLTEEEIKIVEGE
jgi:hypothetical protein